MAGQFGGSSNTSGKRVIGDYNVTQQIGAGSFAVVWKAQHSKYPGLHVAIKEIATERLNKKLQESLKSEIAILQRTNHPNIIRLHDIVEVPNRIYLVLEYCAGGDLAGYIQQYGKVSEAVARHFMRQLGDGLQVLRKHNLIHRDLKPQNLLLSTNDNHAVLKIADFGFARLLQPQGMAETLCGSPLYMAPEILQSRRYDAKADLWSVGAILFQLVTGRPPFGGNNHVQLLNNIVKSSEVRFPDAVTAQLHPDCIDLCRKLLCKNPVERLSFEEFFNHPFMGAIRPKSVDGQARESISGGTGETSETSQEDCFPFLLDDEQGVVNGELSSSKPQLFSASTSASPHLPPSIRKSSPVTSPPTQTGFLSTDRPDRRSRPQGLREAKESTAKPEVEYNTVHVGLSSKGALGDSIDTIEREYVIVPATLTSTTENLAMSLSASDVGDKYTGRGSSGSNQRTVNNPDMGTSPTGRGVSGGSLDSVPSQGSGVERFDGPSEHPPTRLSSLQKCAQLITELATDKVKAGHALESFSIQLVSLAIWKEALRVCQTWADSVGDSEHISSRKERAPSLEEGGNEEASVANTCSLMEHEFAFAVEMAESLALHINVADASVEMPDGMELIFQTALALGRAGAVDELMGHVTSAALAYSKAAALLNFLVNEAVALPLQPPLLLSNVDRHRLCRYADAVIARQHHCIATAQSHQTGTAETKLPPSL